MCTGGIDVGDLSLSFDVDVLMRGRLVRGFMDRTMIIAVRAVTGSVHVCRCL